MIGQLEGGTQTRRHLYAELFDCKEGFWTFMYLSEYSNVHIMSHRNH